MQAVEAVALPGGARERDVEKKEALPKPSLAARRDHILSH
jgi:hypothetical protein